MSSLCQLICYDCNSTEQWHTKPVDLKTPACLICFHYKHPKATTLTKHLKLFENVVALMNCTTTSVTLLAWRPDSLLCTLLFPPKLLTKQSPPTEAETKEESGDSQKMKPSKKRLTIWKGSTKRRCKSQGARKNQETWGEPGQEGAREAQREKKKGSWIYNYMKKSEMHFEDFV